MCFIDLFNEEVFVTNILGEKDRDRETNRVEEFSLRYTQSKYQNQMGWRTTNSKIFLHVAFPVFFLIPTPVKEGRGSRWGKTRILSLVQLL